MSHYLLRQTVCERLRMAESTSYRVVGSAYGARISEDDVVEMLNRSRNESQDAVRYIPSDLMTPAEAAGIPEVAESGITEREIVNWTKRSRHPAPCFRINKQTRRLSRAAFMAWLDGMSRIRRRA